MGDGGNAERQSHLSQQHPGQRGPYLKRMLTEDITTVAAEAYEVVEDE
jgi:hypothetical protein